MDISLTKIRKSTLTREFEKKKILIVEPEGEDVCSPILQRALSRDSIVLIVCFEEGGNKLANSFSNCSLLLLLAKYHSVIVLFLNIFQKKTF